jgi:polysaccharide biosynthesis/export protein
VCRPMDGKIYVSATLFTLSLALAAIPGAARRSAAETASAAAGQTGHTQTGAAQTSPNTSGTYRIGTGDVIQLVVWKEPDLTRDLTVRIDGKVTVPLLGEVTAAGRSAADLAGAIAAGLKQFLSDPQVTVGIGQANGARFFVLGKVQRPGEFPLRGRTTLIQALAMAGGFKEFAKASEIVIVRWSDPGETFLHADYKKVESGLDATQNIPLLPGDTVLVP